MGIFKSLGLRKAALQAIDLIKLIQMYQPANGLRIYKALNSKKGEVTPLKPSFLKSAIYLRNNISDKAIFSQVFVEKQYSPYKYTFPEIETILDAGANIGMASVFFATLFSKAKIIAIEPDKNNFELLQQNTADYPQVTCLQTALWDKNEDIKIANPDSLAASFMVESAKSGSGQQITLKGTGVATILSNAGWEKFDLLKIDIEGAEKEVFSGDTSWLKGVKLMIIEMHDRYKPGCTKAVFKALESFDYECEFYHENIFVKFNHHA